jgi:hypothetical protein
MAGGGWGARVFAVALTTAAITGVLVPSARASSGNESLATAAVQPPDPTFADTGFLSGVFAEPGEPSHGPYNAADVESLWLKWTAPATSSITVSQCHSSNQYDGILEVYEGPAAAPTFGTLTSLAFDDNGCGGTSTLAKLKFAAVAGKTYYVMIGKIVAVGGGLTWEVHSIAAPVNDDFSGTLLPSTAAVTATGSNVGATKEPNEPNHAGSAGGASVWWSWTAPSSAPIEIKTCGSSFNTLLAVYTGSAFTAGVTHVVSNDNDSSCVNQSKVNLTTTANVTYRIAVDGGVGLGGVADTGNILLTIGPRPANDDLANATAINTVPVSLSANNLVATSETDENAHGGVAASNSLWYRWTSPTSAPVGVGACGSGSPAQVGVYTDGNVFPLTAVTPTSTTTCALHFTPVPGTVYAIAVDGSGGAVQLEIQLDTPPTTAILISSISSRRRRASFTFTGTDDVTLTSRLTYICKLDARPYTACTSGVLYTRLRARRHTFSVKAVDGAGNVATTPATKTFRIRG